MRLLFEGGFYSRAVCIRDFTVIGQQTILTFVAGAFVGVVVGAVVVVAAVVVVWTVVVAAVVGLVVGVDVGVVDMVCGGDVELHNFSKCNHQSFTLN